MTGKFYVYNALTLTSKIFETGKNPECPLCGTNPTITGLNDNRSVPGEEDSCRI